MLRDLFSNLNLVQLIDPATLTGDANGSSIDLQGLHDVALVALVGESGDTLSSSVKIELEVEESDDDSSWSDVADSDLTDAVSGTNNGTFAVIDAAAEDDQAYGTSYVGSKRYIRPVVNLTGTHTNGTPIAVAVVSTRKRKQPAN